MLSVGKLAEYCRWRIFPSGLLKEWQPATRINCKLAIYEPLPDDGVEIWSCFSASSGFVKFD
jgi:hypothetical protein